MGVQRGCNREGPRWTNDQGGPRRTEDQGPMWTKDQCGPRRTEDQGGHISKSPDYQISRSGFNPWLATFLLNPERLQCEDRAILASSDSGRRPKRPMLQREFRANPNRILRAQIPVGRTPPNPTYDSEYNASPKLSTSRVYSGRKRVASTRKTLCELGLYSVVITTEYNAMTRTPRELGIYSVVITMEYKTRTHTRGELALYSVAITSDSKARTHTRGELEMYSGWILCIHNILAAGIRKRV